MSSSIIGLAPLGHARVTMILDPGVTKATGTDSRPLRTNKRNP